MNSRAEHPGAATLYPLTIVLCALAPTVLAVGCYLHFGNAVVDMDSISYTKWSPSRSSGYPLFIALAGQKTLLPIQLVMLAGAITWASYAAKRLLGSTLLAVALALALSANPYIWQLQSSIMSEALTTPFIIVLLGALLWYLCRGGIASLTLAAVAAGAAAAARPACLPLVIAPAAAVLLYPTTPLPRRMRLLALVLLVWGGIVAADRIVTRAVHGDQTTSLAGRHLFAKAALVAAPPTGTVGLSPLEARLTRLIETNYAPVRSLLAAAPRGSVRDALRLHYEVCAQYNCTEDTFGGVLPEEHLLNAARGDVGAARLVREPFQALALGWDEYRGMWELHPTDYPDIAKAINLFLARQKSIPFGPEMRQAGFPIPTSRQHNYYRYTRPAFEALGLVMMMLFAGLALAVGLAKRTPSLSVAFIAVLTLQAVLVFGSFAGVGIARYMMGLWPLIVFTVLLPLSGAWHSFFAKSHSVRDPSPHHP